MKDRLKICVISYRSNPHSGGQGVYLNNLCRAMSDLGHDVDVVSGPPDPRLNGNVRVFRLDCMDLYDPKDPFRVPTLGELADPVNLVEWLGVSTAGFPEPFTFGLKAWRFLRHKLESYDLVHDNQSLSYGMWAISRKVPLVATIHHPITVDRRLAVQAAPGFVEKLKQLRWHSFISMQRNVSRALPHIITVSESAATDIGRDFGIPENRFHIVPNGIDTHLFRPLPGIRRDNNRILTTNSADTPLKGLEYLMRAVARIAETRDIRLKVVGTPKKDGAIENLVRTLGIGNLVTFTGRIDHDEFARQYARSTMAVIPSLYEGFGLPAGEAMACAVPVISTTGGALPEVVGDAGMLVPPGDSAALARAITDLMDHPELAEKLSRAGYERVHRLFTWKQAAEQTVAVYRKAIHDHHRH